MIRGYHLARERATRGEPFVWLVDTNYFDWASQLQALILSNKATRGPYVLPFTQRLGLDDSQRAAAAASCHLVALGVSQMVQDAKTRFTVAMGGGSLRELIVLHVRRGDTSELCDTSVDAIERLLGCSRMRAQALSHASPRLVIFTDETKQSYVERLISRLMALYAHDGTSAVVRHGDALLASLLGTDDNFVVFAAVSAIMDAAGTVLRFGFGGACPSHDDDSRKRNFSRNDLCRVALVHEPRHYEVYEMDTKSSVASGGAWTASTAAHG